MSRKTEITESEWLKALEDFHPKAPEGGKRVGEIAVLWKCHIVTAYRRLAEMEAAGKASKVRVGAVVYWVLAAAPKH